ncbi:hypothetical protein DFJ77DRAFT_366094 [Powellomyces hirtus]|nr:hypothetical protein DFJ77DRAFT_366094 [Powellomyces hirtus]
MAHISLNRKSINKPTRGVPEQSQHGTPTSSLSSTQQQPLYSDPSPHAPFNAASLVPSACGSGSQHHVRFLYPPASSSSSHQVVDWYPPSTPSSFVALTPTVVPFEPITVNAIGSFLGQGFHPELPPALAKGNVISPDDWARFLHAVTACARNAKPNKRAPRLTGWADAQDLVQAWNQIYYAPRGLHVQLVGLNAESRDISSSCSSSSSSLSNSSTSSIFDHDDQGRCSRRRERRNGKRAEHDTWSHTEMTKPTSDCGFKGSFSRQQERPVGKRAEYDTRGFRELARFGLIAPKQVYADVYKAHTRELKNLGKALNLVPQTKRNPELATSCKQDRALSAEPIHLIISCTGATCSPNRRSTEEFASNLSALRIEPRDQTQVASVDQPTDQHHTLTTFLEEQITISMPEQQSLPIVNTPVDGDHLPPPPPYSVYDEQSGAR